MLLVSRQWKLTDWFVSDLKRLPPPGGRFPEEINGTTAFSQNGKER